MSKELYNKYKDQYIQAKKGMAEKVIIIGGGCAGLTAGIYAGRAELEPLLFAGNLEDKGGLLTKTSVVENFPSYPDGILGFDLIQNMENQAVKYGTKVIDEDIVNVDFSKKPFSVTDAQGHIYYAQTVIVATGSKPNKLGLEREDELWSRGISSCAVCDGALYKGKKIMVVGGGDSACEEASFLTKFSDVVLVHRRDTFRASKAMQSKVLNNPKIKIIFNTVLETLNGTDKLESVVLKNLKTNETTEMKVDGLFYGLGLKPNTSLFTGKLDMDEEGYIKKVGNHHFETMTSIEGVFVAGDSNDKVYRQAIIAAGDGCKAAMDANNYLNH
ncbi:thioredoxin-disulfide reductase [Fadolivirus algeromassiliense]|jgi:thioredoxin reductase (NADPH)|uniref:Thioredoxin-disulfide reductase n=1 Tax=Fadolivirus FV1/VV64 TaxID=3070911 RepID=A0A7D3QW64_9VIRU|nr:thioredoxin-disulfide reductase [Fadolivirus algeromassiliense]QKF94206.1 thioredoxin-disulfide reductase [Fadolivirus FV1/VV64]